MKKPEIISMIKINGVWTRQEDIPRDEVSRLVSQTIIRAAANIGFDAAKRRETA
ncbi:MAG TPA: hypothetical protein IAB31_04740 [Candidatus Choladousia intestinavium]|uniref:Uncharacterized protein n=1 Tax=Candidatus Choladousia intestinavium TaxID=2840727 RepID=A0A9D1DA18_9FIRM|nr:hypothetical protein [Candidatus Choladousia intestinavium]